MTRREEETKNFSGDAAGLEGLGCLGWIATHILDTEPEEAQKLEFEMLGGGRCCFCLIFVVVCTTKKCVNDGKENGGKMRKVISLEHGVSTRYF
jgi:hypothetical protein